MASHSSILAWRIPIDREGLHGGLQCMGLQRVRHDWVTKHMFLQRYSSSFCSGKLRCCMCLSLQFLVWQLVLLSWLSEGSKQRRRLSLVVVQLLSHLQLFVTPWTAACQTSLSFTISWSLLKLIESMMPSNHLILCHPLLLLPSVSSIRVFSNESALCIRWPRYWSFSFSKSFQWIFKVDFL